MGDFNAILFLHERRGVALTSSVEGTQDFQQFLIDTGLNDVPLYGRKFTWYRPDGSSMNQLDQFLLSGSWLADRPLLAQWALPRGLSDHCPIVLKEKVAGWGPKPFRVFNGWDKVPGYAEFVKESWGSIEVTGWSAYVVKEKLKMLKQQLKGRSKANVGDVGRQLEEQKVELAKWDLEGEESPLLPHEEITRRECLANIHRLSKLKSSMLWQKLKLRWLKEGDANSRFFHSWLNRRRRGNEILCLHVEEREVVEVDEIRTFIREHFQQHFTVPDVCHPNLEDLNFKRLDQRHNDLLVEPFLEDEIKAAVWSCESSKSPGPDGFDFHFIKEFWEVSEVRCGGVYSGVPSKWQVGKGFEYYLHCFDT